MENRQYQVIIVGGGIVGCSIAYHLAQLGWQDILVIDKGALPHNDGSSSHAPGVLGLATGSPTLTRWATYSADLYSKLGYFQRVGGIDIALTEATERELKKRHGIALARGLPARYIGREEREALFPHINHQDIRATLFHQHDGITHGPTICARLIAESGDAVACQPNTPVQALNVTNGRITGITTADGNALTADHVVLATNIWGSILADKIDISIPMLAAEHQYVITEPLSALADETADVRMPNLRYFDYGIYVRQHQQAYGFGSYYHKSRMVAADAVGKTAINPFTPDDFAPAWELMQAQLPACEGAGFGRAFNGMFGFTIDDKPILGETPDVRGLWFALGAWVTHAGGVGRTMANWMVNGTPDCDLHEVNINRFHAHQSTADYILKRSGTHYQQHLQVIHPKEPWGDPRNIRHAPYHQKMVELGGMFDEFAGWEMAQWYEANRPLVEKYRAQILERGEWGGRHWSPICAAEHLATRENAGLFNINGLTRIEVTGDGATSFLERVCANRIDKPVGQIVYTTLLNAHGKIIADLIVVRQETDRYLLITSTLHGQHDLAWLRLQQQTEEQVILEDVSDQWTGLAVWGPKTAEILRPLTDADLSGEAFPYYTSQSIKISGIDVLALNMSFVGELGFEFHVAKEDGLALWDALWPAGESHGMVAVGSVALDSLSKEKGYLIYGHDINASHTPYEAGLGWAVKTKNRPFIGRDALVQQKRHGLTKKRCTLLFDTVDGFAMGGEPVFADEDHCIGYVTSANGGYSVGRHIAYAYLPMPFTVVGTAVEIEYLEKRYSAKVVKDPIYKSYM